MALFDPGTALGLDPYTARLFQIESGNNPNASNGTHQGLGQFGAAEQKQYGITDPSDPQQQAAAVGRERQANTKVFQGALGRDPTPGELYLMHQQGVAGGPALLNGGDIPAWEAIRPYYKSDAAAQKAISGNLPKSAGDPSTISANDFSGYWVNRFNSGLAPTMGAPAPPQAQPAPQQQAALPGAPPSLASAPPLPAPINVSSLPATPQQSSMPQAAPISGPMPPQQQQPQQQQPMSPMMQQLMQQIMQPAQAMQLMQAQPYQPRLNMAQAYQKIPLPSGFTGFQS